MSSVKSLLIAALAPGLASCSGLAAPILSDTVFVTTFDSGWEDWSPHSAFVRDGDRVEASLRDDVAGANGRCAWMGADNSTDRVHQWLARAFRVLPDSSYDLRVIWDIGPSRGLENQLTAVVAIQDREPVANEDRYDFVRLGPVGEHPAPEEPRMLTFEQERLGITSESGWLWVAIGYANGFEIWNWVCIDDVRVELGPSPAS